MDQTTTTLCSTCHQPVLPEYYFCPNCGNKLKEPPLATGLSEQLKVYAHSIVLPFLVFLTIGKWQGVHYLKSNDQKARQIGLVSVVLFGLSTALVVWYTVTLTQSLTQSIAGGMSADLGGY